MWRTAARLTEFGLVRRQGGRGLRLRQCREGFVDEPAQSRRACDGHRNRPDLRAAGGNGIEVRLDQAPRDHVRPSQRPARSRLGLHLCRGGLQLNTSPLAGREIPVTNPASCQLIGPSRILGADLCNRDTAPAAFHLRRNRLALRPRQGSVSGVRSAVVSRDYNREDSHELNTS
jgi:hypothetical protein